MRHLNIIDLEFLILFSIILFLNILIINFRYRIAEFLKIIDIPNERKIHQKPTPLTGGIGFFITLIILLIYIFFDNQIKLDKFVSLISIYTVFFFIVC